MSAAPATLHPPTEGGEPEPWLGYIRVSTWREEKISPELQEQAIRAWASRRGVHILEPLVTDLDMSGRTFKRRIMGAIERVEAGEARGIVVWKFSRFGRNTLGVQINLARLETAGGQLASATEEIDSRTAVGEFVRDMLFATAALESNRAGEQWRETHAHRRALGLPATGGRRLGYIWHPRRIPDPHRPGEWILQQERYEPDPDTCDHIADLYTRKLNGAGYASLAEHVNTLGLRTRRGEPYQADSLRRYMDSGFAAGMLRVHDPACHCDYTANGGRCTRWVHIDGAHDGLITPETWERYQEHRAENRRLTPRARKPSYALTGLVRCGSCRGPAAVTSARRRGQQVLGYAYACDTRSHSGTSICPDGLWMQRAVVEDAVEVWLGQQAEAARLVASAAPLAPVTDDRARAAVERARLQVEAERLAAALTTLRVQRAADPDDWGPGEYEAARDRIRQQQASVTAALNAAAEAAAVPRREDHAPLLLSTVGAWGALDSQEKNRLLRRLVRRVVCTRTGHRSRSTAVEIHPLWEPDPWETAE